MKSLKKMNLIESNIMDSLAKINNVKNKIISIKQHLLYNSTKLLLFKNKVKNLQKMQLLLRDYVLYWAGMFKAIKELKKEDNIGLISDILHHISFGIKKFFTNRQLREIFFLDNKIKKMNYNKYNNLSNGYVESGDNQIKSFKIIDIFYSKCDKKLNKINSSFMKNFSNLFRQRKINYLNFFYYQLSVNKGEVNNFIKVNNNFTALFKFNIKKIDLYY